MCLKYLKQTLRLVLALFFLSSNVFADVLPGPALPEQVGKSLTPQPSDQPAPVSATPIKMRESDLPVASAEEKKITFKLNGISLAGNHVYSDTELLPLYKDKLHKTISIADMYEIVNNITNFYRNNGYILSFAYIPPHRAHKGVVKIEIVEGYIKHVNVIGDPHGAKEQVLAFGERVKADNPLNVKQLRHYMLLANELPNTTVKAVLKPSKSGLGATDLYLDTVNQPLGGYLSYDNYGTRYIGPQQMTANVAMYSIFTSGDSTQFTFTKTPKGGQLTFMDLNYSRAVGSEGARFQIGNTRTQTHPLFVLRPTQTDGLSNNLYMNYIYPVIRTRQNSLNLTAGFNYQDSESTTFDVPLYTDHIRSLDLGVNYSFADGYLGANLLRLNLRKGLPIFGYSSDTTPATATTSRPGGFAAYTKVATTVSRLQSLKGNLSMFVLATGQWAFEPLLSSEQFTFGGSALGRGYDPAELIGDRGAAGSVELRYDFAINKIVRTVQVYSFYDIGAIWNIRTSANSMKKVSASSAGLGIRFTMTRLISGNIFWGQPLTKQVNAERLIGDGKRPRVFFSVVASFN